ncbi:MAG: hypothetical protein ACI83N_000801 [Hydrogenophaga sp.]|jgi:hypothetical protein
MDKIELLAMDARWAQRTSDTTGLVKKYRSIFGRKGSAVDQALSDRLILQAQRQALDDVESECSANTPGCAGAG